MKYSIKKKLMLICMMAFVLSLAVIVGEQNASAATTYTVTLNGNGGSPNITQIKVTKNKTYGTLTTPSRTGYTFSGWYTAASGGTKVTASTKIVKNANHTLYAHWAKKKYTISFNLNGASGSIPSISVAYGSKYGSLTSPTRTGYKFLGWFRTPSGSGAQVTSSTVMNQTSNHTLYARWEIKKYTVTLKPRGGEVSPDSITVTHGGKYGSLPKPERTGYKFSGWYTEKTGGTKVTKSDKIVENGNHKLFAHWSAKSYTVSFNVNGGEGSIPSRSIAFDAKYGSLPTAGRPGYTFQGWFTKPSGGTNVTASTVMSTAANHTLYAQWKICQYTILLDANGGSVSPTSIKVTYGSKYGTLPTPTTTVAGYKFGGWWTAKTGGTLVSSTSALVTNANHTLYARWNIIQYTVTLNGNGGSPNISQITVNYGGKYGTLPTPTAPTGYKFAGWYTAASGGTKMTSGGNIYTNANHTLYAHWSPVSVTVKLDYNDGSGKVTTKSVTYNTKYGTLPSPSRAGYIFDGWYTSGGAKITADVVMNQPSSHTLTAKWTKVTLSVKYPAGYVPLEFRYNGEANYAKGGVNGYFCFEVESNGTWTVTSTLDNGKPGRLRFSKDGKTWSQGSSLSVTGSSKLYVKSTQGGEVAGGSSETGVMAFATGAISKTYKTVQERKDTNVYSYLDVNLCIKEKYPTIEDYKLIEEYHSSGWEKLAGFEGIYYLIDTDVVFDEETLRTYAHTKAYFVEGTSKENLFLREISAATIENFKNGVSYEMGDGSRYLVYVSKLAIKYAAGMKKEAAIEAFDRAGQLPAYYKILKNGWDVITLIADNYAIIRDDQTLEIKVVDLGYTNAWALYDFMYGEMWSSVYGDIKTFLGLAEKDCIGQKYSEARGMAYYDFEQEIRSAGFSFDVWPELFKMMD